MIIQCEKCLTKYGLDESLLKEGGSKVKCSVCGHVFTAYPTEAVGEEAETVAVSQQEIEKTLTQEGDRILPEEEKGAEPKEKEQDFDNVFEESLEEVEEFEPVSPEDLHDLVKKEEGVTKTAGEAASDVDEGPLLESEEEEGEEDQGEELGERTEAIPRKGGRFSIGKFPLILGIIGVILGAAAAIFFWAPQLIPDSLSFLKPPAKEDSTDVGVRRLSFRAVTGSFVSSPSAGELFVIRGMVQNNYPKKRSFILLKGSLLDDKGRVVKRKLAYAGNSFKDEQIKELSLEKMSKAMRNRYGTGRNNFNVRPGAFVPFTIVFEELPENLSEFTVEAVSSTPGT